jgi:NADH:ubiquinone oxidoreductase subunit F (NADH-binding)
VLELPAGSTLRDAVAAAGGLTEPVATVVTGGWHGRWVPWSAAQDAVLSRAGLDQVGGRWGAGVFVLLAESLCPVAALAAVARTLAEGSSGQCGPCRVGLPQIASDLADVCAGVSGRLARDELRMSMDSLRGRGLCAHPTAAVDALSSALDSVAEDLSAHAAGTCTATRRWQP